MYNKKTLSQLPSVVMVHSNTVSFIIHHQSNSLVAAVFRELSKSDADTIGRGNVVATPAPPPGSTAGLPPPHPFGLDTVPFNFPRVNTETTAGAASVEAEGITQMRGNCISASFKTRHQILPQCTGTRRHPPLRAPRLRRQATDGPCYNLVLHRAPVVFLSFTRSWIRHYCVFTVI